MTPEQQRFANILARTADLTANQRLILLTYDQLATERNGTVMRTAKELAGIVGLHETVFTRLRKQLVQAGWLEESDNLGRIRFYRLTHRATGEHVVVPLRRAT